MKILLTKEELVAALIKHYPALAGHEVVDVEIIENRQTYGLVAITMSPVITAGWNLGDDPRPRPPKGMG